MVIIVVGVGSVRGWCRSAGCGWWSGRCCWSSVCSGFARGWGGRGVRGGRERGPGCPRRGAEDSAQRAAAAGGTLLSSFGTFWAVEGLGVAWPGSDAAILVLVGWYVLAAAGYVGLLRRRARRLVPEETGA